MKPAEVIKYSKNVAWELPPGATQELFRHGPSEVPGVMVRIRTTSGSTGHSELPKITLVKKKTADPCDDIETAIGNYVLSFPHDVERICEKTWSEADLDEIIETGKYGFHFYRWDDIGLVIGLNDPNDRNQYDVAQIALGMVYPPLPGSEKA